MTSQRTSTGRTYLATVAALIERLEIQEWPQIDAAAAIITDAMAAGGVIHAFGSGHSHMLAEELFYRAGGLVRVEPILFEGLMLHASAPLSTSLERVPGLATAILDDHAVRVGRCPAHRLELRQQRGGHRDGACGARARPPHHRHHQHRPRHV